MMYLDKDMERVMQKKKRDIINELEAYKNKILHEMSGVDKTTLTRLRQIMNDYNKIEIELEKYGEELSPLVLETKELREELKEEIDTIDKMNNFITAEAYGAVGDGVADDTAALQCAIAECSDERIPLYIPKGKIYRITNPLNFINGEYKDVKVCIDGFNPCKSSTYVCENYGGFKVENGVSLFKNAKISGSINRACIIGERDESVKFFDNCVVSAFTLSNNIIANFGSIFYNSSLQGVSSVTHNVMLSCFYFAQCTENHSCVDSHIENNYINGGEEPTNNACFEWISFNGSNVTNNFIDYYKVMYRPVCTSPVLYEGPTSTGNQYQVFRYFYIMPTGASSRFVSIGDTFNWNDETASTIKHVMDKYTKETYTGQDGEEYEIPNYIVRPYVSGMISFKGAKIEGYIDNIAYIDSASSESQHCEFKCEFIGTNKFTNKISYKQGSTAPLYNATTYGYNDWHINLIEPVDTLPAIAMGWSSSFNGRKVLYKNTICTATNVYDISTETWTAKWLDQFGNEVS